MTVEITLVLGILIAALVLFISGRLRMDLIALLVLGSLVVTNLVTPEEAVAGFSNVAVIAVWAMFILSDALTRAGISDLIGAAMLRLGGRRQTRVTIVIMLVAGTLSFFMNNIAVVALMLPVVIDLARRTRISPSHLLMPLTQGTLLGGMATLVATPVNLLISNGLVNAGFAPFGIFDFLPLGALLLLIGTAFITLIARHLLPAKKSEESIQRRSQRNLRMQYGLQARYFEMRIAPDSLLVGSSLGESRISTAANLIVLALERNGRTEIMPQKQMVLEAGDVLHVQGRLDRFKELQRWSELVIEREAPVLQRLMASQLGLVEVTISAGSPLESTLLDHSEFRKRYHANVLALRRGDAIRRANLTHIPLKVGDVLLVQARADALTELERTPALGTPTKIDEQTLNETYRLQERIFVVRVPKESALEGDALAGTRFADAFDFRLLAIFREGELEVMPDPDEPLRGRDLLLIQGREEDLDVLRGLQELQVERESRPPGGGLDSERLGMIETTLHPRSKIVGQTVRDAGFREKYGLELAAVWRSGEAFRLNLDQIVLELGDALLLLGPRERLLMLERDPDFLPLTPLAQRVIKARKAPIAGAIMLAVIGSVFIGWLPIHIAALIGATLMVLTNCLSMEEAYRSIDWRAIFLIAGLLPLGTALEQSGAAHLLAEQTVSTLGPLGPWWVIGGLYLVTLAGNMIIPGQALAVLMSPIVVSTSVSLGFEPRTAMMAVAIAASSSFLSPVSHAVNLLIMGPGGYRFTDYLKTGLPLAAVTFVALMLLLPWIWPLTALPAAG